jgi:aerotaxis receptor
VRANAVPIVRNGRAQGHMSVRTAASREESAAAEKLYAAMREKRADVHLHKGLLLGSSPLAALSNWRRWWSRAARRR